ncbi:MAG: hypothetical protein QM696_02350 [Steroidobacteraceae bacterium]
MSRSTIQRRSSNRPKRADVLHKGLQLGRCGWRYMPKHRRTAFHRQQIHAVEEEHSAAVSDMCRAPRRRVAALGK